MEVDLTALKSSGAQVEKLGTEIESAAENSRAEFDKGGSGNAGFSAVGAVAAAADVWLSHVEGIGGALENAGAMITQASVAFDTTDRHNADDLIGIVKDQLLEVLP